MKTKIAISTIILFQWMLPLQARQYNHSDSTDGKPAINADVLGKWPTVAYARISNDGKYALYYVVFRAHSTELSRTLIVQATRGTWKNEFSGVRGNAQAEFVPGNKIMLFRNTGDSLVLLTLGTSAVKYIPGISAFAQHRGWLMYTLKTNAAELHMLNLASGEKRLLDGVADYIYNERANVLLVKRVANSQLSVSWQWYDLTTGNAVTFWLGNNAGNFVFDLAGGQVAFIVDNAGKNTLWAYKPGKESTLLLTDNGAPGIAPGLNITEIESFSDDGHLIFFRLGEAVTESRPGPDSEVAMVDIWSYTDVRLQSQQLKQPDPVQSYLAVLDTRSNRAIRLEHPNDHVWSHKAGAALIEHKAGDGDISEQYWNPGCKKRFDVVSLENGSRQPVTSSWASLSLNGKYAVYYDSELRNYCSYEVATGTRRNITRDINASWTLYEYDHPDTSTAVYGVQGWLKDDAGLLLHDGYDIWQVDFRGIYSPINLTGGYGRAHNIVFFIAQNDHNKAVETGQKLLLTAFDRMHKENGFYNVVVGAAKPPEKLIMGPYVYYVPNTDIRDIGEPPVKARDADAWLVRRMSAEASPNYFFSTDLKSYSHLSNVFPERDYNWIRSELVTWKDPDGNTLQGILYKPENFDPHGGYPVIFHYYERLSDNLHVYFPPEPAAGPINIPWFVSNGYLVFTPDIHYQIGRPGKSSCLSVISAAKHLSELPFVDSTKMGIQGHSFGGFETNYIVTRTGLFAAACSAAGLSNFVSCYGSVWGGGDSRQGIFEFGQNRMGATLWQMPDLYLENSPVLQAYKVTTPVLLMNNKADDAVAFEQGVEFFTALRRLGKRAWMLQYDGEGHGIMGDRSSLDYTVRITQFFDHYLKGKPAPKWMTKGIKASRKGSDNGFELDVDLSIPPAGLY